MRKFLLSAVLATGICLAYQPAQAQASWLSDFIRNVHVDVYVPPVYGQSYYYDPYYVQPPVYAQPYYVQPPVYVPPITYGPVLPRYYGAYGHHHHHRHHRHHHHHHHR